MANSRGSSAADIQAALQCVQSGDYERGLAAIAALSPAAQRRENVSVARLKALRCYPRRQRDDEVLPCFDAAVGRFAANADLHCELGWFWHERGEQQKAEEAFTRALQIDARHEGAWQGQIAALRRQRRFEAAERQWLAVPDPLSSRLGILCEGGWIAVEQEDYRRAQARFAAAVAHADAGEDHYLWQLFVLRKLNLTDDAHALLQAAIDKFTATSRLRIEAGWLLLAQRDFAAARDCFVAVLREWPNNEAAFQGKIAALRFLGALDDADDELSRNAALAAISLGVRGEQAWVAFENGDWSRAEQLFRQICDRDGGNHLAKINLAWVFVRMAEDAAYAKAAALCRQSLSIRTSAEALGCLGVVSFKQQKYEAAESYLKQSIDHDPLRGHHADLGALYTYLGRYPEAETVLAEGIAVKPYEVGLLTELASLRLETGEAGRALLISRRAVHLSPRHREAVRSLILALAATGRISDADSEIRAALKWAAGETRVSFLLLFARLLIQKFDETKERDNLAQALLQVASARAVRPASAESFFLEGIAHAKQDHYRRARAAFDKCHALDGTWVQAETYAAALSVRIDDERRRFRNPETKSWVVVAIVAVQLAGLWVLKLTPAKAELISDTTFSVLMPLLIGLMIVAFVLPTLSKFSLTGLAVEIDSVAKLEQATGPKGNIELEMPLRDAGRIAV